MRAWLSLSSPPSPSLPPDFGSLLLFLHLSSVSSLLCFYSSTNLPSVSPLSPVLFAETVNYFFPHLVEVHNYSAANSFSQKMYNWQTLNSTTP